jgi:hypothetical protein
MRPVLVPPALLPAVPVVMEPRGAEFPPLAFPREPPEFAVPAAVPSTFRGAPALAAPLGSFNELLRPAGFAGPFGAPLIAELPAPAEPALGAVVPGLVPTEPPDEPPAEAPLDEPPRRSAA